MNLAEFGRLAARQAAVTRRVTTMSSAPDEDTLRRLQLVRDEIDLTQRSIDDSAPGANVNEALVTVADALWVASEVLDFYEALMNCRKSAARSCLRYCVDYTTWC